MVLPSPSTKRVRSPCLRIASTPRSNALTSVPFAPTIAKATPAISELARWYLSANVPSLKELITSGMIEPKRRELRLLMMAKYSPPSARRRVPSAFVPISISCPDACEPPCNNSTVPSPYDSLATCAAFAFDARNEAHIVANAAKYTCLP